MTISMDFGKIDTPTSMFRDKTVQGQETQKDFTNQGQ